MYRLLNFVRFAFLLLLAGALAVSPAAAASKKAGAKARQEAKTAAPKQRTGIWSYGRDDEAFVLQYSEGRATPFLVVTCRPGAGLFQIVVDISPPKTQAGDAVRLRLANGKTVVEFAASAFPSETQGSLAVEAQAKLEPKLIDVFKNGEHLKVTVPGAAKTLPLASAEKRLRAFETGCLKAKIVPRTN